MGKEVTFCAGTVVLIVSIGLIIGSFGYVAELQHCLKYHTISRVIKGIEEEKGTHFIGVAQAFMCFPSQRLTLEFAPEPSDPDADVKDNDEYENGDMPNLGYLKSRTSEGLDLKMDVLVEYKLREDEDSLTGLFHLVGTNFTWWYKDVVTASLMNTASQFQASAFLSKDREKIAVAMLAGLKARSADLVTQVSDTQSEFFMTPLSVQLRHVDLPSSYEGKIKTIEGIKLDKRLQDEVVKLDVAGVDKTITQEQIEWHQTRSTQEIAKHAEVKVAALQRNVSLTEAETGVMVKTMTADREREVMVVNAGKDFAIAELVQTEKTTKQTTEQQVAVKKLDQEIIEATAQKEKTLKRAAELAYEIEAEATAAAAAMQQVKAAELAEYGKLNSEGGMGKADVLQHVWMSTLKKLNKAKMFLDYRKVPMFLEAAAK